MAGQFQFPQACLTQPRVAIRFSMLPDRQPAPWSLSLPARFLDVFFNGVLRTMKEKFIDALLVVGAIVFEFVRFESPKALIAHVWEAFMPWIWVFSIVVTWHSVRSAAELIKDVRVEASTSAGVEEGDVLLPSGAKIRHERRPQPPPHLFRVKIWTTSLAIILIALFGSAKVWLQAKSDRSSNASRPIDSPYRPTSAIPAPSPPPITAELTPTSRPLPGTQRPEHKRKSSPPNASASPPELAAPDRTVPCPSVILLHPEAHDVTITNNTMVTSCAAVEASSVRTYVGQNKIFQRTPETSTKDPVVHADNNPVVSGDPLFSHASEIVLHTDRIISPAGFDIECACEIGRATASALGHTMVLDVKIRGHLTFTWEYPVFSPESPIKIKVWSKDVIRITRAVLARRRQ